MSQTSFDLYMARVQKMAKWIAGHAVVVHHLDYDYQPGVLRIDLISGTSFTAEVIGFPREVDIARCALALEAAGVAGNFDVPDFATEDLLRFLPPFTIALPSAPSSGSSLFTVHSRRAS